MNASTKRTAGWKIIEYPYNEDTFMPVCHISLAMHSAPVFNTLFEAVTEFAASKLCVKSRKQTMGVFVYDPDGKLAASCCFRDGEPVFQSGDPRLFRSSLNNKPTNCNYTIAVGDPFTDGLQLHGLFKDASDAQEFAENEFPTHDWRVVPIY